MRSRARTCGACRSADGAILFTGGDLHGRLGRQAPGGRKPFGATTLINSADEQAASVQNGTVSFLARHSANLWRGGVSRIFFIGRLDGQAICPLVDKKAMEDKRPSVLLIAEGAQGSSYLASRLDKRGCECSFALSCQEAFLIRRDRKVDLVLSPTSLREGALHSVINLLEESDTTVFYSHVVERGCWWLPALWRGEKCFGSSALRPSEFVPLLDQTIKDIQSDAPAAPESRPLPVSRADVFVMSPFTVAGGISRSQSSAS